MGSKSFTERAARLLAQAELSRRRYNVSVARRSLLKVEGIESGSQFLVQVRGVSENNPWLHVEMPECPDLFFILVRVGKVRAEDHFFVFSHDEINQVLEEAKVGRSLDDDTGGFRYDYALPFEEKWGTLPQ